jgi:hypothetical protein
VLAVGQLIRVRAAPRTATDARADADAAPRIRCMARLPRESHAPADDDDESGGGSVPATHGDDGVEEMGMLAAGTASAGDKRGWESGSEVDSGEEEEALIEDDGRLADEPARVAKRRRLDELPFLEMGL